MRHALVGALESLAITDVGYLEIQKINFNIHANLLNLNLHEA